MLFIPIFCRRFSHIDTIASTLLRSEACPNFINVVHHRMVGMVRIITNLAAKNSDANNEIM